MTKSIVAIVIGAFLAVSAREAFQAETAICKMCPWQLMILQQLCSYNNQEQIQVSSFVISLCFLSIVSKFGIHAVYPEFATVCLLAVLVHIWQFMETKGTSLKEIESALIAAD